MLLRFAIASDGHLGEPATPSAGYLRDLVDALNADHAAAPLDFVAINGDIGHGGAALLRQAREVLEELQMPWQAVQGNHDEVTAAEWESIWGTPPNEVRRFGSRSILLANTSNERGDYLCVDQDWLTVALAQEASQDDVFVVMHITPKTWTKHGIDCPSVRSALAAAPNLRAVFNGHDHDQDGMLVDQGVPYLFDAHYGGTWGTAYRGYRVAEVDGTTLTTHITTVDGREVEPISITW